MRCFVILKLFTPAFITLKNAIEHIVFSICFKVFKEFSDGVMDITTLDWIPF